MNLSSKTFCPAPFVHMYVHKNEDNKLCCETMENEMASPSTETDLEKRWKSDYYKNIRQQFLDGEEPDICSKCFAIEKHNGISDRIWLNRIYQDILEPNIETGNQYNSPIDLDIRPGNLCNLKCRMCGPESSSQIEKETLQHPDLFKGFHSQDIQHRGCIFRKES